MKKDKKEKEEKDERENKLGLKSRVVSRNIFKPEKRLVIILR